MQEIQNELLRRIEQQQRAEKRDQDKSFKDLKKNST